jgi:hypothetical protein
VEETFASVPGQVEVRSSKQCLIAVERAYERLNLEPSHGRIDGVAFGLDVDPAQP